MQYTVNIVGLKSELVQEEILCIVKVIEAILDMQGTKFSEVILTHEEASE